MIYTIRTTSGREEIVMDMIETKIRRDNIDIKSVVHPAEIKGYVFIEGSISDVHRAVQGIMHVRGIIEKPVKLEEIQRFLEYKKTRISLDIGDIVEIVGGSFKSEKGKVTRVDNVKGEVTIELLEASIPIPVTIATELVKVIKKAKPEQPQQKKEEKEKPVETELEEELEKEEEKIKEAPEGEQPVLSEEEEEAAERRIEEESKEEETITKPEEKEEEDGKTDS